MQFDIYKEEFFRILNNFKNNNNLENISTIFNMNNNQSFKIDKNTFINGLKKLGYTEDSSSFIAILNKYEYNYNKDMIVLNALETDFNLWCENNFSSINNNFSNQNNNYNQEFKGNIVNNNNISDYNNIKPKNLNQAKDTFSFRDNNMIVNDKSNIDNKINYNTHNNNFTQNNSNQNKINNSNNYNNYNTHKNNFSNQNNNNINKNNNYNHNNNNNYNFNYNDNNESYNINYSKSYNNNTNNSFAAYGPNKEKLDSLDLKLQNQLKQNRRYIQSLIYQSLYKEYIECNKLNELKSSLFSIDKTNSGFISKEDFQNLFESIGMILSDKDLETILSDLSSNSQGLFVYEHFISKITNFKQSELDMQIRNYNYCYNDYIVLLRNYFRNNNIDIAEAWKDTNNGNINKSYLTKNEFIKLLNIINFNALETDECEYIFYKIAENASDLNTVSNDSNMSVSNNYILKFLELKSVLKLEPPDIIEFKSSNFFNLKNNNNSNIKSANTNINNYNNQQSNEFKNNLTNIDYKNNNNLHKNNFNENEKSQNNFNNSNNNFTNNLEQNFSNNNFSVHKNSNNNFISNQNNSFINNNSTNNINIDNNILNSNKLINNNNNVNNNNNNDNLYNQLNSNTTSNNNLQNKSNTIETKITNSNINKLSNNIINIRKDMDFINKYNSIVNFMEKSNFINLRISNIESKVRNLITKNNKYVFYEGLEILQYYFQGYGIQNVIGYFYKIFFQVSDKKIKESDFKVVIPQIINNNNNFTNNHLNTILSNIKNKTLTTYSYEEFTELVYNYNRNDKAQLINNYNFNFNDFVLDFKMYLISYNKNSYQNTWMQIFGSPEHNISLDMFKKYCMQIEYVLLDDIEYDYLFNKLTGGISSINLNSIINIVNKPILTEEEFVNNEKEANDKINKAWKSLLNNYNADNAKLHQVKYQNIYNILKSISNKAKSENVVFNKKSLIDFFSDSNIMSNGELSETEFVNKLSKIKITSREPFYLKLMDTIAGKSQKSISIVKFFDAYYSFFWKELEDIKEEGNSSNNNLNKTVYIDNANSNNQNANKTESNNNNNKDAYKYKVTFNDEEINYINEFVDFTAEIILDEQAIDIDSFYKKHLSSGKQGYTLEEFKHVIEDVLAVETDENNDIFFNYLLIDNDNNSNLIDVISIDRIMYTYNKFSKRGVKYKSNSKDLNSKQDFNNNKNNKNNFSNVTNEEAIIKDFAELIKYKRIPWLVIFPNSNNNYNNNQLSYIDFENGLKVAKFEYSSKEFNNLLNFLDPSSKRYIPIDVLKNYIKKFENDYFDLPFQNTDKGIGLADKKGLSMESLIRKPHILAIIKKMNNYIHNNKLLLDDFFKNVIIKSKIKVKDFSNISSIKLEFSQFVSFIKTIDNTINPVHISELFKFIDKNNSDCIELNELKTVLEPYKATHEEIKNSIKLTSKLSKEINDLFDKFDTDKNNTISHNEMFQALKSYNSNITYKDVDLIIKQVDKDGNKFVDKNEFTEIMENYLKEEIAVNEEEKNYMLKLFQEEDYDKLGYMTIKQMKHLLIDKLNCNFEYDGDEINNLINAVDSNYDGKIDINEFINLLDNNVNSQNTNNSNSDGIYKTIRSIKFNRRLNPSTFLNIFKGLPMNFIPSFIRSEQKLFKLLPGNSLIPIRDKSKIIYLDILPSNLLNSCIKENSSKNSSNNVTRKNSNNLINNSALKEVLTDICCKITFETATGVPIPDQSIYDRFENIVGRTLKICFYNKKNKKLFGNSISIECSWKKENEDRWYFEEDNKKFNHNIIIRYSPNINNDINQNHNDSINDISVVFEFVIHLFKDNSIIESSCGWSEINLYQLNKSGDLKLSITGGSPFKHDVISDTDIKSNKNFLNKLFKGNKQASLLPIKIKTYKDLNSKDKDEINYLPFNIILHKSAIHICSTYRKFISKNLFENFDFNNRYISNHSSKNSTIIKYFIDIVNCHEAFKIMVENWNYLIVEGNGVLSNMNIFNNKKIDLKNKQEYYENCFILFVNIVYSAMQTDKFNFNKLDPAAFSFGDPILFRNRFKIINSLLRSKFIIKNSSNVDNINNIDINYTPFSVSECKEDKLNLMSDIEDIYNNTKIAKYYMVDGEDKYSIITNSRFD